MKFICQLDIQLESIDYAMSIENNQLVLNYKRAFSGIDVKIKIITC